jgi:hypothetical protein
MLVTYGNPYRRRQGKHAKPLMLDNRSLKVSAPAVAIVNIAVLSVRVIMLL